MGALERQERFEEKPREGSEAFVPQAVLKAVRIQRYYQNIKGGHTGEIEYRRKRLISVKGS